MAETPIEKLDAPTRVRLRSSQILTSLPQIVSELVQNSLDANATAIEIGVDCEEWLCWVKDNGIGIAKEDLLMLTKGSEEGRYGTSKLYVPNGLNSLSTFGFRGEALASCSELCCLEISSRTSRSRNTWSIITRGSKSLYSGPAVRWRRELPGTVVCIRDAFYNLPVRRLSHPSSARTVELIRQEMETLALAFPAVSFSLENLHKGETGSSRERIYRIPKTSSPLAAFRNIYGRALTEHVEEIDSTSGELRLQGFISLNGAHSKAYQFLYVNNHALARCDLHHVIESKFALSTFGKNALDEAGEINLPRSSIRRSPRKMERRPVYVLNLTVPPGHVDNCYEPTKTHIQFQHKEPIAAFLSSVVQDFLVRHEFHNREITTEKPSPSPSPKKRRKVDVADDSGYAENTRMWEEHSEQGNELFSDFGASSSCTPLTADDGNAHNVTWTDPNTGESFVVDIRTGNSCPHEIHPANDTNDGSTEAHDPSRLRRTLSMRHTNDVSAAAPTPDWLKRALEANQIYTRTEQMIPNISMTMACGDGHDRDCQNMQKLYQCYESQAGSRHAPYRFGREDLHHAQVIGQVDEKFIACLLDDSRASHSDCSFEGAITGTDGDNAPVLVLIDQHAADERVRVEGFLEELCSGYQENKHNGQDSGNVLPVRTLSPPRPVLLTSHEAEMLRVSTAIQNEFRAWGFEFSGLSEAKEHIEGESNAGYTQVFLKSIPEVVADKLLMEDELRDLVKGYLGRSMSPGNEPLLDNETDASSEYSWLKALRHQPRELLELINSKACRGAIMFNDALSMAQCEALVQKLSRTAFPFQCAHGRPSLVPLMRIPGREKGKRASCDWKRLEM